MKYLFSVLLVLLFQKLTAQDLEKPLIGITNFKFYENGGATADDARLMQSFVTDAFINSRRFTILERQQMETINAELDQQKEETTINTDFYVEQGKILGAKYLLLGTVNSLGIEEKANAGSQALGSLGGKLGKKATDAVSSDRKVARIGLAFRIVNVETGEVQAARTITVQPGSGLGATDRSAAVQNSRNEVIKETNKFIKTYLPLQLGVLKVLAEKKGKLEQFYMSGGSANGITVGNRVVLKKVEFEDFGNGKTKIETSLGEAKVVEVKGDKVSLCEVKKGGKEILASLNGGSTVVCETIN